MDDRISSVYSITLVARRVVIISRKVEGSGSKHGTTSEGVTTVT